MPVALTRLKNYFCDVSSEKPRRLNQREFSASNKNNLYKKSKCISVTVNSTEKSTIPHILMYIYESLAQFGYVTRSALFVLALSSIS